MSKDQIFQCVDAGLSVISTCEELSYPYRKYPELAQRLDAEASRRGVRVLGAGINPGFLMDKLVLTPAQELISPYGGRLVNLVADGGERQRLIEYAGKLPSLQLSPRSLCDIELLAVGAFSPLDRFM